MRSIATRLTFAALIFASALQARPEHPNGQAHFHDLQRPPSLRLDCQEAAASPEDLKINNVRARLMNGGTMWYDPQTGVAKYIVPNVAPGEVERSSLYAGGIWLGAVAQGGNLIVAAATFIQDGADFYPGPLTFGVDQLTGDLLPGITDQGTCANWDRFFTVYGSDIDNLRADWSDNNAIDGAIADNLLKWPARGNPYFSNYYPFALPDDDLAPFIDRSGDCIYDPYDGDFPIINVYGCERKNTYDRPIYADQMTWWVFNDAGNIHRNSAGDPMHMEVQAMSFAYSTADEFNNMTFYYYKLINKNTVYVDSTHFAIWNDPDLGCANDDYIGCNIDTLPGLTRGRDLGIVYNADNFDDISGCGSANGYGSPTPMLGVDFFRGPRGNSFTSYDTVAYCDTTFISQDASSFSLGGGLYRVPRYEEVGLSAFTYYYRGDVAPAAAMGEPANAPEFFNLLTGRWKNGTDYTAAGNGYQTAGAVTRFVYPGDPSDANDWSMCQVGLTGGDLRFLHSSGPFRLLPGRINELITGIVWIPDDGRSGNCPNYNLLLAADDRSQSLFDNCFKLLDGPDAPDMDIVEMNKELIIILTNKQTCIDRQTCGTAYEEVVPEASQIQNVDNTYNFEGYKVYQLKDANASDLNDPDQAALIYQCDVKNGITRITNWTFDPSSSFLVPSVEVVGADKGVSHTFKVTQDAFSPISSKALVNHRKYFFKAVAYAYNNYTDFNLDLENPTGQQKPYLQGRKNTKTYTGIPRINSPEYSGTVLQTLYGEGPAITRVDGKGNSGGILEILNDGEVETGALTNNPTDRITYMGNTGPVLVTISNPLRVPNADFSMTIYDGDMTDNSLDVTDSMDWKLDEVDASGAVLNSWYSENNLDAETDQAILDLGITLKAVQKKEPGTDPLDPTGFLGAFKEYRYAEGDWWQPLRDDEFRFAGAFAPELSGVSNFLRTDGGEYDNDADPQKLYTADSTGWFPTRLAYCKTTDHEYYFTPNWINDTRCDITRGLPNYNPALIYNSIRNVNVVVTPDRSKWSRCIVTETASPFYYTANGLNLAKPDGQEQCQLRNNPSVGQDGQPDGDGTGRGWFPGFAYDVETGERLNIFFGENGYFKPGNVYWPTATNGDDMIFNPSDNYFSDLDGNNFPNAFLELVLGGQHMVYVTDQPYDQCTSLYTLLQNQTTGRAQVMTRCIWSTMPMLSGGYNMADGTPPSEVVFKMRVNKPYKREVASNENDGYPKYNFSLQGYNTVKYEASTAASALDLINVVPNPYYAFSDYETTESEQIIKIVNLPPRANISIYSIDGRLIRTFKRDVSATIDDVTRVETQINTGVEWDLKNEAAVPVASGVYLVRVQVPGVGEKTVKAFIINRNFDVQKL